MIPLRSAKALGWWNVEVAKEADKAEAVARGTDAEVAERLGEL